jgi:hypothetical protein
MEAATIENRVLLCERWFEDIFKELAGQSKTSLDVPLGEHLQRKLLR